MPADPAVRVVAAIDFGTHGTGFAWALCPAEGALSGSAVYTRDLWPGAGNARYPKNRTALLLDRPGGEPIAFGHDAVQRYRATAGRGGQPGFVANFKVCLTGDEAAHRIVQGEIPSRERARELTTQYLRYIVETALKDMEQRGVCVQAPEEIRWCLTVPALWGYDEQALMRGAAEDAGLPRDPDRLVFTTEPEAAMHHVRHHAQATEHVAPGKRVMVVDAGGGTVDVVTYFIESDGLLREVGHKRGALFGCEAVTDRFLEEVVLARLTPEVTAAGRFASLLAAPGSGHVARLVDAWDRDKTRVGPTLDYDLRFDLTAELYRQMPEPVRAHLRRIQNGVDQALIVTPDQAKALFDPVVAEVLALIDEQLRGVAQDSRAGGRTDTILLVGGFANSPYLEHRVRDHLGGRCAVVVAPETDASVLKGAVQECHRSIVLSRKAGFSYGIKTSRRWRRWHDPRRGRVRDQAPNSPNYRKYVTVTAFDPMVAVGEDVGLPKRFERNYVPYHEHDRSLEICLYRSGKAAPRFVDRPGCELVDRFRVDLAPVLGLPRTERGVVVTLEFGTVDVVVSARFAHTDEPIVTVSEAKNGKGW